MLNSGTEKLKAFLRRRRIKTSCQDLFGTLSLVKIPVLEPRPAQGQLRVLSNALGNVSPRSFVEVFESVSYTRSEIASRFVSSNG